MPNRKSISGSELFIVDNSDEDWKVVRYLHDWCQISASVDIATGYFEIGALLALKDEWQKVDKIRILMGDEVSMRTRDAFVKGLEQVKQRLDDSIEKEKEKNDFLVGVGAIVEAIRVGKIECRVYRKDKFHAKAYITHGRLEVVGASALVGSSNFTCPGLTENIELNVQITGRPVAVLQEWFEEHWKQGEDVSTELLRVVERHVKEYSPFEVYAKALQEYFKGHELSANEWEQGTGSRCSAMYPKLDAYQKDGYHALLKIANSYQGAFLCDGVGLGKTFVGLMLIERFVVQERKNVCLLVPKSAREAVWESAIRRYLPDLGGIFGNRLFVLNHTDLIRETAGFPHKVQQIKESADIILIDEAHHFRNPGTTGEGEKTKPSRYRKLFDICEGKQMFFLTATPVNNRLIDLQHIMELFTRKEPAYFSAAPLGIHSLAGHFRTLEKELEQKIDVQNGGAGEVSAETNINEAAMVLSSDALFRALVVQRSRAFVKRSQEQANGSVTMFPEREAPRVQPYSVKRTYGKLLGKLDEAFSKVKPLFSLAIYYPLAFYNGEKESPEVKWEDNRQKQVVGLIRTQFLKRFESSAHAFEMSCQTLLIKILAWVTKHAQTVGEKRNLERWMHRHAELIGYVHNKQHLLFEEDGEMDEDLISEEMLEDVEELERKDYDVEAMLDECYNDLDQLVEFLKDLKAFEPKHDDKLQSLIKLMKSDEVLKTRKVLIFSEFAATARYLRGQLTEAGIDGVAEVDSGSKVNREEIIRRFAPYYNGSSSGEMGKNEIRVLISTDVLSEGLNLQDATRLINYDLHWNPVRLMQRIGRVDRRMNPQTEAMLLADHPEQKELRGKVAYWNFLPPEDVDSLLKLYLRVSHKTLRISKTFGIEGKKLLKPEDDYEALKDFNHTYEGETSPQEELHLEYQRLLKAYPDLEERLNGLPGRVFSGKESLKPGTQAVFFCYALPAPPAQSRDLATGDALLWTEEAGQTRWVMYVVASGEISEEAPRIAPHIRSTPETPRKRAMEDVSLSEIRVKVEKHLKNSYLKAAQAPAGVKPQLKAWMELC